MSMKAMLKTSANYLCWNVKCVQQQCQTTEVKTGKKKIKLKI